MNQNIFYNSEMVFIEYKDIIKTPDLFLLDACRENQKLEEILDFTPIKHLGDAGLKEWYINRTKRNIFANLLKPGIEIQMDDLDKMVNDHLESTGSFFIFAEPLAMAMAIRTLIKSGLANKIVIHSDYYNKNIEKDIIGLFGKSCKYIYGKLDALISEFPKDSTYMFSDIDKVATLYENEKLAFSSIVIPMEYRYNKSDMKNFKINFAELNTEVVFKYGFIRAFSV